MTAPAEDPPKKYGISEEDAAGIGAGGSAGDDDAPVPKLPRGSGFKLSTPHLMRIGMIVVTLFALVVLQKPCSNAVSRFVTTFGGDESAGKGSSAPGQPAPAPATSATPGAPGASPTAPTPSPSSTVTGPDRGAPAGAPPIQYERLTPSMTDEELRAAIERAKRRAAAAEAAGSGGAAPAAPAPPASPPPPSPAGSGGQ